jgi:hypothetical protein
VIDDDKGITFAKWTINGAVSSGGTGFSVLLGATPLVIAAGANFNNNKYLQLQANAAGDVYTVGSGAVWRGIGETDITPQAAFTYTLPATAYTGTGVWYIHPTADYTTTINLSGALNLGTAQLNFIKNGGAGTGNVATINTQNYNVTCGAFSHGASVSGTYKLAINYGSSVLSTGAVTSPTVAYTTGYTNIDFGTSQWTCSGAWTFASNHTITASAGQIVNITGLSKITSNGKSFPGALTINNTAHTVDSLADSLDVAGDFTIQMGQFRQNGKPFAVHGDYYSLSSDTSNMNATKYLYKSWTRGAGSNVKNDTAITKLVSDNLCNLTTNTARLNYVHIKALSYGIQKVKQLDNAVIVRLRDSIGAWNQNGFTRSDSIAVWLDSGHIWNAARVCWKYSLYGPNFKATTLTDTLTYAGSAACSLVVSCVNTIGNVKVNLTGAGSLKQVGATHYGALNVADGVLSPTDTIYATSLNWTSTDTSTLGVVIVSGSAYIASTAKLGATKIIMLSQCSIGGGNANLPPVTYPAGCGATKRRNGWIGLGVNNGLMW